MPRSDAGVLATAGLLPDLDDEIAPPPRRRVLMHNDDRSTLQFVVAVLRTVFCKSTDDAERLAMTVHETGLAAIGVYSIQVAEARVDRTHRLAEAHGHPLRCTIEEE